IPAIPDASLLFSRQCDVALTLLFRMKRLAASMAWCVLAVLIGLLQLWCLLGFVALDQNSTVETGRLLRDCGLLFFSSTLVATFAVIATRVFLAQRNEAKKIAQHFSYTQDAVTSISGDVKTLHAKVDTALIPKLDAVYGRLSEATRLPTISDLLSVLKNLGYQ